MMPPPRRGWHVNWGSIVAKEGDAPETEYVLPQATLDEHAYLHAIVIELRHIRFALEAQIAQGQEIDLREPTPKVKPKRGA